MVKYVLVGLLWTPTASATIPVVPVTPVNPITVSTNGDCPAIKMDDQTGAEWDDMDVDELAAKAHEGCAQRYGKKAECAYQVIRFPTGGFGVACGPRQELVNGEKK